MSEVRTVRVSVDLPREDLDLANELVPAVQKDPQFKPVRISRMSVLRMAISEGLKVLREKYPKG